MEKLSSEYLAHSTDKLVISKMDDEPIMDGRWNANAMEEHDDKTSNQ